MKRVFMIAAVIVALFVLGTWIAVPRKSLTPPAPPSPSATSPIATLHYVCDGGKTIDALLYEGSSTPPQSPGMPRTPGGSAALSLSDGRSVRLPQTISADGVRYANADESLIFWTKGDGAFVMEGNAQTFANCAEASSTAWMKGMKIVTQTDNGSVIRLAKNERFLIQLGDTLSWTLSFTPSNIITRVPNSTTADGFQEVYEGSTAGTATLRAIGAPICAPNAACPLFRIQIETTFVVGS